MRHFLICRTLQIWKEYKSEVCVEICTVSSQDADQAISTKAEELSDSEAQEYPLLGKTLDQRV
jgi:hypothetical protein